MTVYVIIHDNIDYAITVQLNRWFCLQSNFFEYQHSLDKFLTLTFEHMT